MLSITVGPTFENKIETEFSLPVTRVCGEAVTTYAGCTRETKKLSTLLSVAGLPEASL
jgi:hypothetical protein